MDGLLSVDLISVGFVPFPALLIEIRSSPPQAARSTGDLAGGGRDNSFNDRDAVCARMCGGDGEAAVFFFELQFLSVLRQDEIKHFLSTNYSVLFLASSLFSAGVGCQDAVTALEYRHSIWKPFNLIGTCK